MLSDSIFEAIEKLLDDIGHYGNPPFSYSNNYRANLIEALANLYYVKHALDMSHITMDGCREEATNAFDMAINISR